LVIDVPPGLGAQELERKQEVIEVICDGATLDLQASFLYIRGSQAARRRAQRYVTAVCERSADLIARDIDSSSSNSSAYPGTAIDFGSDVSIVPAPIAFTGKWREGDMEKTLEELGVLVVLCDGKASAQGAGMFSVRLAQTLIGQVVEARYKDNWWIGSVLGANREVRGSLRIQWAFDGSVSDLDQNDIRATSRIAIFGSAEKRLEAELLLLTALETQFQGIVLAHLATRSPSRGLGLEAPPDVRMSKRTREATFVTEQEMQGADDWRVKHLQQGNQLKSLLHVSGCTAMHFFEQTCQEKTWPLRNMRCALAGTHEQRWLASNIVQFMSMVYDRGRSDPLPDVPPPPPLAGEYLCVRVPNDCMASVQGRGGMNCRNIEEELGCLLIVYRERPSSRREALEADEVEDYTELMFKDVRCGPMQEIIIFGSARARHAAHIRLLSIIERQYCGFHRKPKGGEPKEIDESTGLGIDKVWLQSDLEPDATNRYAKMLGAAAGCAADSAGHMVFISGDRRERQRCREYLRWVVEWAGTGQTQETQRLPRVEHAGSRKDVLLVDPVPRKIWTNVGLKDEMLKLSESGRVLAFFDDWVSASVTVVGDDSANDARRMVLVGIEIERQGVSSDFAAKLLSDFRHLIAELEEPADLPAANSPEKADDDMPVDMPLPATPALPSMLAMPATPARSGGCVPLPATPGGFNAGLRPPATPSGFGGVRPPATPGAFGGSVQPPATPGGFNAGIRPPATPGGPSGNVPPPATPGGCGGGVRPPATPAGPGGFSGGIAPPATPGAFGGGRVPPPGTPAPAGFGPGIAPPATPGATGGPVRPPSTPGAPGHLAMPQTPAGGARQPATPSRPLDIGISPPATPGGFGPHGSAMPNTPAPGLAGLAPPATPGGFGPHGHASPCTPGAPCSGSLPPPVTPGAPARALAPPATPVSFGPSAGLAAPCTPALPGGLGNVPPPATPGGLQHGAGRHPDRHQEDLYSKLTDHEDDWLPPLPAKRTSTTSLQEPASKRWVPAPQTPGGLGTGVAGIQSMVAAPQTPASASLATAGQMRSLAAPQTPASPGEIGIVQPGISAPRTPAKAAGMAAAQAPEIVPAGSRSGSSMVAGKLLSFSSLAAAGVGLQPLAPQPQDDLLPPGWEKRMSSQMASRTIGTRGWSNRNMSGLQLELGVASPWQTMVL